MNKVNNLMAVDAPKEIQQASWKVVSMVLFVALSLSTKTVFAELPDIVTPYFTTQVKHQASDHSPFANFGNSVAIDGDTAVIGAFRDGGVTESGAAYVFVRKESGWVEQQKLVPDDLADKDLFGRSVAISGDSILISSLADDDNGIDSGAAYVFVRLGDSWIQQQKLLTSDGSQGNQAGWSVDLDGDTALIGVWLDDDNGLFSGSAYVFVRENDVWTEQQKLLPADGATQERFGIGVSVSGDTAIISAMVDDAQGAESGSAYIFQRSGQTWVEQQKLLPSDGAAGDRSGISVSIDSNLAVIGSWRDDDQGNDSGSVYMYENIAGSWTETQKLIPADGGAGQEFGYSVSISGDTLLVGSFSDDDQGVTSGSAYIFKRIDGTWIEQQKLLPQEVTIGDQFGVSVAVDGLTAISGSWWSDENGDVNHENSGVAYFYETTPVCDATMSQLSYVDNELVSTATFRLLTSSAAVEAVEWKAWLKGPSGEIIPTVNRGADGSFILAPGTDFDLGNVPLFNVNASMPRGRYTFACRFMHPVTGATRTVDKNTFEIK